MAALVRYAPRVLSFSRARGASGLMRSGRRIAAVGRKYRMSLGLGAGGLGRGRRPPGRRTRSGRGRAANRRVGERVGSGTAKRNDEKTNGNLNSRTLYIQPLLNIPKGADIDQRERLVVNFRGVKFCHSMILQNGTNTADGQQVYLNRVIVSEKGCDAEPATNKFFRGNATDRGTTFSATALSALDFHCLPLNTDKWNVHMHKRSKLAPYSSTEGKNARTFQHYFKLNRQIRYLENDSIPIGKQVYYMYWFDFQGKNAGDPIVTSAIQHDLHLNRYFRDPKN